MSRTRHKTKGAGYEYWASRLHPGGEEPGRWTKTQTHRKERRDAKEAILVAVEQACADALDDLIAWEDCLNELYGTRAAWDNWAVENAT